MHTDAFEPTTQPSGVHGSACVSFLRMTLIAALMLVFGAVTTAQEDKSEKQPEPKPDAAQADSSAEKKPDAPAEEAAKDASRGDSGRSFTVTVEPDEMQEVMDYELFSVPPWDFAPYKVLIWIASDRPEHHTPAFTGQVKTLLQRDYNSIWDTTVEAAPPAVNSLANRSMDLITYDAITASDPVLAVRNSLEYSIRIQNLATADEYLKKIQTTETLLNLVKSQALEAPTETETETEAADEEEAPAEPATETEAQPEGEAAATDEGTENATPEEPATPKLSDTELLAKLMEKTDGSLKDALKLSEIWVQEGTEALIVPRGQAIGFAPEGSKANKAKIIELPISGLVKARAESFDKIFVVHIDNSNSLGSELSVVEIETLMQTNSETYTRPVSNPGILPYVINYALTDAFSPLVRLDEVGRKKARGIVRAAGLITDPDSAAHVPAGSLLQPLLRRNGRDGKPLQVGRVDWAYLMVKDIEGARAELDLIDGMAGGPLSSRPSMRVTKWGRLVKPSQDTTTLRLHAKKRPDKPLIGYELHQRSLGEDKTFSLVGRTDWNGNLVIGKDVDPVRVLYVKNGGAILAKLPVAPGLTQVEVADLAGDDMRLQAEAYVRGLQNQIIDLVAIRKLLDIRIRKRVKERNVKEARAMLTSLIAQQTRKSIAADLELKLQEFVNAINKQSNGNRSAIASQKRKVELLFKSARTNLDKNLTDLILQDLQTLVTEAEAGRFPPAEDE